VTDISPASNPVTNSSKVAETAIAPFVELGVDEESVRDGGVTSSPPPSVMVHPLPPEPVAVVRFVLAVAAALPAVYFVVPALKVTPVFTF
jgi:hypothetical protein